MPTIHTAAFGSGNFLTKKTRINMAQHPTRGLRSIRPKPLMFMFRSLFTIKIEKDTASDSAVVIAAAFNRHIGIKIRFKTKFKTADTIDEIKHNFSFPFGKNIVLPIHPPKKEKNRAIVKIRNDVTAPRNSSPLINKIISLPSAFIPTMQGNPKNMIKFSEYLEFLLTDSWSLFL